LTRCEGWAVPRHRHDACERTRPKPKRRVVGRPRASADLDHEAIKDAIVAALKDGPQRPRDVATKIGGDPHAIRFAVKRLQAEGRVRAEGKTNDRRWMLSKAAKPAKEDP
jgi:predicted Rossmann fold nucleotide-binding protein DprA/Smf involved in DNA uptake